MKPYYEEKGITIWNCDCRDVLPELGIYDVVLTDPPFGNGDMWQGGTWARHKRYSVDAPQWDDKKFSDLTLAEVRRSGVHCVIWGGNYYELPISRCWFCWNKMPKPQTLADFELAWTNLDMPSKMFLAWRGADGITGHPTPKPLTLFKWCLSFFPQAKTILDPFMGSGTTLRAAKDMGFKTIVGIEKVEKYAEMAVNRLKQETLAWEEDCVR
jgi:site-specific DNA-methyltransferase (adenine-specific)